MANEVLVEEYGAQVYQTSEYYSGSAIGKFITSQILDIGELSAVFNEKTKYVIIQSLGASFWVAPGTNAQALTNGNIFVPVNGSREFAVDSSFSRIDTA